MSKLNPWQLPDLRAGQNLTCRVEQQERDGYAVTVPIDKFDLPGFLPTDEALKIGQEVLAQFVCVSNNRILLSSRFSHINANRNKPIPYVRWEDKLYELDYAPGEAPPPPEVMPEFVPEAEPMVQNSAVEILTEEEEAFRVWAGQITPQRVPLRRATDLLVPPINPADVTTFTIAEHDLEWLVTDLEGGMRSGCLKVSSESVKSRSGMLLYRGRCVGCIYGNKQMPESPPNEEALAYMLADMRLPDTQITMYDLPEDIVLASSSLFLGHPLERNESRTPQEYFQYTLQWLEEKKQTACMCMTVNIANPPKHCFIYIYRGQYVGAFYVEDQSVSKEISRVYSILNEDPQATFNVLILPPEMTSSAIRFGFSLSVPGKR